MLFFWKQKKPLCGGFWEARSKQTAAADTLPGRPGSKNSSEAGR